jgi:hypothetical protein
MLLPFPRSLPNGPRLSFTPASLAPRLVMPSKAGIALRLVRLAAKLAHRARAFVCLRQPSYFLFARPRAQERVRTAEPARRAKGGMPGIKRKITEEKGHPAWRLFGIGNRSCVASTPASMPSPALAKRSRHPCRLPLRVSTPTHRRTGAPVDSGPSWPALGAQPLRGCESGRSGKGNVLYRPEADISVASGSGA